MSEKVDDTALNKLEMRALAMLPRQLASPVTVDPDMLLALIAELREARELLTFAAENTEDDDPADHTLTEPWQSCEEAGHENDDDDAYWSKEEDDV